MLTVFAMTESERRLIFAIIMIVLLLVVLAGFIGWWIYRVMKWQGKKMDNLVHDVVVTRIITDSKSLKAYGRKKSFAYFFKQAWIPVLLIAVAFLILLINDLIIKDFHYNVFNTETGIATLFFLWDFDDPDIYTTVFGMRVIAQWPAVTHTPTFVVDAITSYLFIPICGVGMVWFMVCVQCLVSRWWRLRTLCDKIFDKSLEGYNQNAAIMGASGAGTGMKVTADNMDQVAAQQQAQSTTQANSSENNERPPIGSDSSNSNKG
ncbi:MAG: hypothetical protein LUB56_01580 [Coprobacillus sp.]|nr:hypothetical protein [Coprobacillus sp.]